MQPTSPFHVLLPPHFTSLSLLVTLVLISSTHSGLGDSPQSHPLATPRFPHVLKGLPPFLPQLTSYRTSQSSLPFPSWLMAILKTAMKSSNGSLFLLTPPTSLPPQLHVLLKEKKSMESNLCCPYTPGCVTSSHKARTGLKLYVSKNNLEPLIPLPPPLKC